MESKPETSNQVQKATHSVKVSLAVRKHIVKNNRDDEPIDRTLRRLLKLPIPAGVFLRRVPRNGKRPDTTTIKVSDDVRNFIAANGKWGESADHTLRRLLGLSPEKKGAS